MGVKSVHRTLLTKLTLLKRKSLAPIKYLGQTPQRRVRSGRSGNLVTIVSRAILVTISILLLSCTCIDILRQSFMSGQFWNGIIVVVVLGLVSLWSLLLSLIREVDANRWLAAIPRGHQVGSSDLGSDMMDRVQAVRQKCSQLFENQMDFSTVEHEGLQNPLRRSGNRGTEGDIETPYWAFADSIPLYLEDSFTSVVPDFTIPPSHSMRDYVERAILERIIDATNVRPDIDRFLDLFEKLKYSGKSVSHAELIEMMESMSRMTNELQQPDVPTSSGNNSSPYLLNNTTRTPPRYSNTSLSRILNGSSSSLESVRRYPTRESVLTYTSDSQRAPSPLFHLHRSRSGYTSSSH